VAYSGPGAVIYNSRTVLQSQSVGFQVQTDNKDVMTLAGGRVGHSRGAKKVQVSVDNAIPELGFEIDWVGIANAQLEINLSFRIATKTYNCRGDIRDAEWRTDVDATNKLSFTFHGIIVTES
jgi:hypothetical protein